MSEITVCDTKVMYDTHFEAELALARSEYMSGSEMEIYECGRHFHLTTKDRSKRRGVGHKYFKCECGKIVKVGHVERHLATHKKEEL